MTYSNNPRLSYFVRSGLALGLSVSLGACAGGAEESATEGESATSSVSVTEATTGATDSESGVDSTSGEATSTGTASETTTSASASETGTDTTDSSTGTDTDTDTDTDTTTGVGEVLLLDVELVPQAGVSGVVRVNFAVPLAPGELDDADAIFVRADGSELARYSRSLALHPDGSVRSVHVQVDVDVDTVTKLEVEIGGVEAAQTLEPVPVAETLVAADGTEGPQVWALLPPQWLSKSGVAGPLRAEADDAGTPSEVWGEKCDYTKFDVNAFKVEQETPGVWLFDRGTTHYRGYARGGQRERLETAYVETAIYRAGLMGAGVDTTIGVPTKAKDAKYFYAQNLAIHYLLSGDDRFRESAEDIAEAMSVLWSSPGYDGGADFWTERHAGFALLAYVWAAAVSDDQSAQFKTLADEAMVAYVDLQETDYPGATEDARCFRHDAAAHSEGYGYWGCSPWMSAILADGIDAYARQRPGTDEAELAHTSLLRLARSIAADGLDDQGKPLYWMGPGEGQQEVDSYDEHWGESAYILAIGSRIGDDPELESAAAELIEGFADNGAVPHMRSFNWQCRSAVATSWFLDH